MDKYVKELENHFEKWGEILSPKETINHITENLSDHGFAKENARLVFSVCPDDINRLAERKTIENMLTREYNSEFHLGGLGAYPIGGVAGLTAASHHPPDRKINGARKDGNLILFLSPHMGLVENSEFHYGKIVRLGQKKKTAACGALMGFFAQLEQAGSLEQFNITADSTTDPSKLILYQTLVKEYDSELRDILALENEKHQIASLFKLNHTLVNDKAKVIIDQFLKHEDFEGDLGIISGLTVNTVKKDYFILKELKYQQQE